MALGSGSVTPMQMATAYGVFATGGYRVNPMLISASPTRKGKVLHEEQPLSRWTSRCAPSSRATPS
jgi:penicillin-binding protein 1A